MEQTTTSETVTSGLDAAEASSPVEAVEAVTRELGRSLGARHVSFLIADHSGRALVRLAHVELRTGKGAAGVPPVASGERRADEESATVMPFDGGPAEQAVRSQQIQVVGPDAARSTDGGSPAWLVLAPVTERGEAIGVLELALPDEPNEASLGEIAQVALLLAFVVIANERHTSLFRWGRRSRALSLSRTSRDLTGHCGHGAGGDFARAPLRLGR